MEKFHLIFFVKRFYFILLMTKQKEIYFIYNAKGGKWNYIVDTVHKYVSPNTYECNLCQITYDLKMKRAWKDFIEKKKPTKKKIDSIKKQKKCLSLIDKQCDFVYDKNLNGDTDGFKFDFIKINNNDNKNSVNIIKIFAKLNTSLEIPFIKIFLNDRTESYYKLYDMYYKKI